MQRIHGLAPRMARGASSLVYALVSALAFWPSVGNAQSPANDLDSLLAQSRTTSPALLAARARTEAASLRVTPAGLRSDPMLMLGVLNVPISNPGFDNDDMTMKMVGIGQTIPFPGKLGLRRSAARHELDAARAAERGVMRQVERDVRDAYYEMAFLDRALEIIERNRDVLVTLIKVSEARYGVGAAEQQDVLKARVEAARLAESAVQMTEQRRAGLARLNARLSRPTDAPIEKATVPTRIARAAVADSAPNVRFVSAALGARAADSPLPSVDALQTLALRENPSLREAGALIAAQSARIELARKDYLPDFDVALQYGQRVRRSDMITATVSVPLPLQRRRKQDALVGEARASLSSLEAERATRQDEIRADVARLHAELERDRAQLALYKTSIIPQGRAALASATASYQVGRVEFLTLLDNQVTLFNYETEYFRVLTDFARTLGELERIVGTEVLP